MVTANEVINDIQQVLNENSFPIRIRYFTYSGANAGYDDDVVLTASGTDVWASGLTQPLKTTDLKKSSISILQEQGQDLAQVQRLYVLGNVSFSGDSIKVGLGSPVTTENSLVPNGVESWNIDGTPVYNMAYIQRLTNGSYYGG